MGEGGLGHTVKKMSFVIGEPSAKKMLWVREMRGERRPEDAAIVRKDSIAERVEVGDALDGLAATFRFVVGSVFAMATLASKPPQVMKEM